jgi:hypothetical protein
MDEKGRNKESGQIRMKVDEGKDRRSLPLYELK